MGRPDIDNSESPWKQRLVLNRSPAMKVMLVLEYSGLLVYCNQIFGEEIPTVVKDAISEHIISTLDYCRLLYSLSDYCIHYQIIVFIIRLLY